MSEAFRWWLVLQVVGLLLFPLCFAFFRRLPDRGYALSKPFGLFFLGYTFWFLNSLRLIPNSPGGIIFALLVLLSISGAFAWYRRDEMWGWARDHWLYVVGVEALLLVVFAVAVRLRSLVGVTTLTEQPMDMMLFNAATRAAHFPPQDPWLSGHHVVYYYFGYLIVAMTGRLAGVPPEIGYNIGFAMIAALALVGAAGLTYDLVRIREGSIERTVSAATAAVARLASIAWKPVVFGLAGGVMLVVIGDLVGLLQFMSAYGSGGKSFYHWLDVQGLTANEPRLSWYPSSYFGFFDASRIYPLDHAGGRVITEFPMFSFLLGDLHPHVMSLPFVLLAVGAALTLYRSDEPVDVAFWLKRPPLLVATAVIIGGLVFLNTWDIVTFAVVVIAAVSVSNYLRVRAFTLDLAVQVLSFALPLGLLAFLLYLPFYVNFESQADGIGAVVSNRAVTVPATRPVQAFIYWAPLFIVVVPFVCARLAAARSRITFRAVALSFAPLALVLVGWLLVYGWENATDSRKLDGAAGLATQIADRGSGWLTAAVFGALLAAALLVLWLEITDDDGRDEREGVVFTLVLVSTALLLVLATEFFYVGDVFNSRMNTVFKLYYQAWLLLAISGGFSLYYLASRWRFTFMRASSYRITWAGAAAVALAAALLYPLGGTFDRIHPYDDNGNVIGTGGNIDALHFLSPDERAAVAWLQQRAQGQDLVIAEAVGDDYWVKGEFARVSSSTGVPAVLGWAGHENQWHGSSQPYAGRFEDVSDLYRTNDMNRVSQIVKKYDVTYIYVGDLERRTYGDAALAKFQSLPVAFQQGNVTIYRAQSVIGEVGPAR